MALISATHVAEVTWKHTAWLDSLVGMSAKPPTFFHFKSMLRRGQSKQSGRITAILGLQIVFSLLLQAMSRYNMGNELYFPGLLAQQFLQILPSTSIHPPTFQGPSSNGTMGR
jgi:hypothetical protein